MCVLGNGLGEAQHTRNALSVMEAELSVTFAMVHQKRLSVTQAKSRHLFIDHLDGSQAMLLRRDLCPTFEALWRGTGEPLEKRLNLAISLKSGVSERRSH